MGQSTHHRLDRLQIVSVGSLRDQSTTQFHRWRSTNKILSCEVITRMLLGRIFRGHTCGGPPYLDMRAPEWHSSENLAGYRQSFIKQQERIFWRGIVDIKTIWFVFLLILLCWRVFFLGSPALHYAGTDRLQMVGVRSLHADRSWLLVSSYSRGRQHFLPPTALKCITTGTKSYAAHRFFNAFLNLVTKCWKFE